MLWWVAQNLVVTALLAGLVWIVCKTTRIGPATRHALWLVVLLKLLTPPVVVWPWGVAELFATLDAKPTTESEAVVLTEPVESIEADSSTFASPASSASEVILGNLFETPIEPIEALIETGETEISGILLAPNVDQRSEMWTTWLRKASRQVWLAGAIIFALLQAIRIVRMAGRLRHGKDPQRDLLDQVAAMSRRLRIKPVETRSVDGVGSPCIWAFVRPRLLWPGELTLKILPSALRGIIVHELAHVKRRDHWVGWLELIAGCVWWWNPLFWYVRHQLRENAELACDAWVVGTLPSGRRAYAEGLLAVCESVSNLSAPLPAVGATASGRQSIERRLNMILRGKSPFRLSRGGFLAALFLAAMSLPAWSQRSVAIEEKEPPNSGFENIMAEVRSAYSADFVTNAKLDDSVKVVTGNVASSLPADAQEILNQHRQLEEKTRREAERLAVKRRQALIRALRELQDRYTRAGKLDEAVAVRDEIERLQGQGPRLSFNTLNASGMEEIRWRLPPKSVNLSKYRGQIGKTLQFEIVGETKGDVWGSNPYTDESSLAAAAVHAGALHPGQQGIVRVTIHEDAGSYKGLARNGVKSSSYGKWEGSFRVESPPNAPQPDPGTLSKYRDRVGEAFAFRVVGVDSGTVWGTDVYTDDSPLATAAVHAGLLKPGQEGVVYVTILPGQIGYSGSTRHGVTTDDYQSFSGSFRFLPKPKLIGSVKPVEFQLLGPMVSPGEYDVSGGREHSTAPTDIDSNSLKSNTIIEMQSPIIGQGATQRAVSPYVASQPSASHHMTREQLELLTRFIAAQSRTVSREERKAMSKWFRSEWTAKGFPVTPAVEWLLKQDNIAVDAGKFIDDVDSIPVPSRNKKLQDDDVDDPTSTNLQEFDQDGIVVKIPALDGGPASEVIRFHAGFDSEGLEELSKEPPPR